MPLNLACGLFSIPSSTSVLPSFFASDTRTSAGRKGTIHHVPSDKKPLVPNDKFARLKVNARRLLSLSQRKCARRRICINDEGTLLPGANCCTSVGNQRMITLRIGLCSAYSSSNSDHRGAQHHHHADSPPLPVFFFRFIIPFIFTIPENKIHFFSWVWRRYVTG